MKKIVSLLLGFAMLFSVSCKKQKENSITDPSVEDSSVVSESSDPVPDSTESTDEDSPSVKVRVTRDLEYLPIVTDQQSDFFYPREVTPKDYVKKTDEYGNEYKAVAVPSVQCEYDVLRISGEENARIQEALDAVQNPLIEDFLASYEKECERVKALDESSYPDSSGSYLWMTLNLHRADTQVISFSYVRVDMAEDEFIFDDDCEVNISTETGKILTLSDLVKDKAAFEEVLMNEMEFGDPSWGTDDDLKSIEEKLHKEVGDDSLEFQLFYDRIEVHPHGGNSYMFGERISVPVFKYPEVFNMDFFGHVPEYYFLRTGTAEIYWDFNGDGELDIAKVEPISSSRLGMVDYMLFVNDERLSFTDDNRFIDMFMFVQADDGQYLYMEELEAERCIRIESDLSLTDTGENVPFLCDQLSNPYDPAYFPKHETVHLLGIRGMTRYWKLLGVNGVPEPVSVYYNEEIIRFTSEAELPAVIFDMDTRTGGKQITIPEGSTYEIVEYNEGTQKVIFRISPPGAQGHDEDYYAMLDYVLDEPETDGEVPTGRIGGIKEYKVFDNLQYGD